MSNRIDFHRRRFIVGGAAILGAGAVFGASRWIVPAEAAAEQAPAPTGPVTIVAFGDQGKRLGERQVARVVKSPAEWKRQLGAARYHILREQGTERPFTGKYYKTPEQAGIYRCQGCDNALYDTATQFHSGTGWPSFYQPIASENVIEHSDRSFGMVRTEIACTRCGGHLGHKFHDGPQPTGLRYCMDSLALRFVPTGAA